MLFEVLVLVLGIPVGFLIAWMARDELLVGRKWFVALMLLSLICSWFFFGNTVIGFTCAFIFILSGISYYKSFDRTWTTKRS